MYKSIPKPQLLREYLTDERQSTAISVNKCNRLTGHKVFKAAAGADDDDGNDDSGNNNKCLIISMIHEAFQSYLFSTLLLLDPS